MEGVHVHAYSTLLDTLGLPETEYQAFAEYKEMADKHDYVGQFDSEIHYDLDVINGGTKVSRKSLQDTAKTLAVYSAFTEGLQLFSSFVILLNFTRFGKMKGMGQIVTWSIRDESLHVESMIKLFREFCKENPELVTDDFKKDIYDICRKMVELEDNFIDLAFAQGGIEGLTADEVKTYIRYIADRRLISLGLRGNYKQKTNPLEWVDYIVNGVEHANFFETKSTAYSKGSLEGSWDDVWET